MKPIINETFRGINIFVGPSTTRFNGGGTIMGLYNPDRVSRPDFPFYTFSSSTDTTSLLVLETKERFSGRIVIEALVKAGRRMVKSINWNYYGYCICISDRKFIL